jgi:hypothetical protein
MIESLTSTHADWVVGIARIVLGIIFFAHGAQKLLGWFGVKQSRVDNQRRDFSQCRACVVKMCCQANDPMRKGAKP